MKVLYRFLLVTGFLLAGSLSLYAQDNPFAGNIVNVSEEKATTISEVEENTTIDIKENAIKEVASFSADTARARSFLKSLKKLSDYIEADNKKSNKWYWSNSNNKRTFESQEESGIFVCNNALLVVWGLADCGVFKNKEKFYTKLENGYLVWNTKYSDTKKNLLKYADLIKVSGTAKSLIDANKIKAGDICCSIGCGTFVYAGNDMWFDASRKGCENTVIDGKHYYKKIYTDIGHPNAELTYVIRLRDTKASDTDKSKEESKDDNTVVADNSNGNTKNLAGFLASLKKISDICKKENEQGKPWFYSNSQNKNTMEAQRKSGRKCSNCALYVVWALADCGVFQHNEKFYGAYNGVMKYSKGAEEALKKYCTITHPNKTAKQLIKEGKLKAGDICCYPIQHTNVYAGNNMWWDAGRGAGNTYTKGGVHYFKSMYSKNGTPGCKVTTLIRFKK